MQPKKRVNETSDTKIQRVAVIGTGLMGHGIAQTFAVKGYDVCLLSRNKDSLDKAVEEIKWSLGKFAKKGAISSVEVEAALSRIKTTTSYVEAVGDADLVLESVSENIELKRHVFSKIDELAPSHTLIATNTSTLSVTEMGKATKRPEKTVGMHWFIPPQLTQLIEVIRGKDTSDQTLNAIMEASKRLGKTPILCKKDVRGFIVSRILVAMFNEAFWTYSRKEASMMEIDASVRYVGGFPMGWFELVDFVGVDVEYDVSKILHKAHGERYRPRLELTEPLVKAKKLGRKTGMGFYDWSKGRPVVSSDLKGKYDVERSWAVAANEAAWMILEDVAEPESIDLGMKLGTGWPLGPCEYADKKGLDNILKKLEVAHSKYSIELYKPCPLLKDYVKNGWTGKKAGNGFHKYI
ncbi:MAG: 3-hydroxybutyryl-CoA dehydrogenase [Candidatus Bathyarchaeum sp.]|nr:MAG: 3-hydroxybutyryl-CoA dehydrogenase [Candidatus Bathyarchaeum sp.]